MCDHTPAERPVTVEFRGGLWHDQAMADDPLALARAVATAARARGGRAVVVGGFVRDRLLGLPTHEVDLELYGVPEADVPGLLGTFGRVEPVGQSFPVYKLGTMDVALPRRESKSGRGHKGFAVQGDPWMPFAEATRRRDFTINAIAWDPLDDVYEDPFGGRADLAARVLRVVDPATFGDDSLRVLRALQFAARFELQALPETRAICAAIPLDDLPAERVWGELEKLLLRAARPSIGFALGHDLGVIERLWPEMHALVGCEQEPEWHPEGDVWVHTLLVVDEAARRLDGLGRAGRIIMMLGAVCHDFGKPATTAFVDGRIRSIGHEEGGVAPATAFLDRLNVRSFEGVDVRRQVLGIVAHHLKPGMWHKVRDAVGDGAFRRLAQKVDLELLARLASADCNGRTGTFDCSAMTWFVERARTLGVEHRPPARILLGRHLVAIGVRPGPRMGEILDAVYERQLDGTVTTVDEGIAAAREFLERR
jgi:tRNA nucleotidyltransferase (CCA-adding enzyme)